MSKLPITLQIAQTLDQSDPLAHCRERFNLPEGVIYLDGNSLGALPKAVAPRLKIAVEQEWGVGLIRSWNDANWYPAPQRVGARVAQMIGADGNEVIMADSTSVNLFKVLIAALRLQKDQPGRDVILTESGNFPTDGYIAQGAAELVGARFKMVEPADIMAALDESVAVVTLTHVNYKTGRLHDMAAITKRAHEVGALVVWDLAHTAGAMPCDLNGCVAGGTGADFAVGCGYKYLNGGPGAPAFVFAAKRHHAAMRQPLTGWHGHAAPFAFTDDYTAGVGMDAMLVGTASQLGLIALEAALTAFDGVDMNQLRSKSLRLTDLFMALVKQELGSFGFGMVTPEDHADRGSQVALTHLEGYAVMQAVIAKGVIGDFRAPNILRFGFAALYVSYVDVWNAIAVIKEIMQTSAWQAPQFMQKKAVT
jgi:kynureninase